MPRGGYDSDDESAALVHNDHAQYGSSAVDGADLKEHSVNDGERLALADAHGGHVRFFLSQLSKHFSPELQHIERVASIPSSIINLSNTILGAGMLGLPYAVSKCGYVFGSILLVACAFASAFGLFVLVLCSDKCGSNATYYVVASKTFPKFAFIVDLIVFIKCFGVAISYLVIVGDNLPDSACFFLNGVKNGSSCVADGQVIDSFLLAREFWIGMSAIIIIPVAFLPTLDALQFTSALALGAVAYLLGLVVATYPSYTNNPPVGYTPPESSSLVAFNLDLTFFRVMTIYVFGFTCHQNIFSIYNELKEPSHGKMRGIIGTSIGTSLCIYLVIALLGYFTFGDSVASNIMSNFSNDVPTTIGRLLVAILVIFSYPLQSHPDRVSLDNLFRLTYFNIKKTDIGAQTRARYIAETCFILAGTFTVGLLTDQLDKVLSFIGAIGSTTMCYILPGLFYLKLNYHEKWTFMHYICCVLVGVGCFVMPTALAFVFIPE